MTLKLKSASSIRTLQLKTYRNGEAFLPNISIHDFTTSMAISLSAEDARKLAVELLKSADGEQDD